VSLEFFVVSLLGGLSYGLLLFMLSSGFTLIFSMMGVLNFAHASFYMLGAYLAFSISGWVGFWPALFIAPALLFVLGALFEKHCLRRVHAFGHVPELLVTFGLSYGVLEVVQLVWGRSAVPYGLPPQLQGPLFSVYGTQFPKSRAFIMAVALGMMAAMWLLLTRTRIGLVIQAALTHPQMAQALGHNVPRVFMAVFGGGAALAGLAGVIGGNTYVTEPGMALSVGSIVFVVVVVGGLGSLGGALLASLLIGTLQTFAVGMDQSLAQLLSPLLGALGAGGVAESLASPEALASSDSPAGAVLRLKVSQLAPILPYLLLVAMLVVRPQGLLGKPGPKT
jgi:branched-chain amino acid transport system permease protein